MRTAIIILAGLIVLGISVLVGSRAGNGAPGIVLAAKIFVGVWLIAALINMWIGVARAGYSVAEELPIFLVIFAIPAAAAAFAWWRWS